MTEPRWDDIAHIREQIASGAYETRGKLRIVADRLQRMLQETQAESEPVHPECSYGEPLHDHGDGCPSCDGIIG